MKRERQSSQNSNRVPHYVSELVQPAQPLSLSETWELLCQRKVVRCQLETEMLLHMNCMCRRMVYSTIKGHSQTLLVATFKQYEQFSERWYCSKWRWLAYIGQFVVIARLFWCLATIHCSLRYLITHFFNHCHNMLHEAYHFYGNRVAMLNFVFICCEYEHCVRECSWGSPCVTNCL